MNQTTRISLTLTVLLTVGAVTVPPTTAQPSSRPYSPALAEVPQDGADRRREAAAAARARARYDAKAPRHPQPQPPSLSRPPYRPRRQPSQLGALLRSAGQVARTIERTERGRFNLPRELNRAGRMIDRHQRR